MSSEWSVLLSADDQEFIQTIQFYYDLFRDMNAEYSQKVFALQSHYLGDVDHFQYPDSAQYWYLTFYGSFQSIKNAAAYIKEYTCIVCYDANEHMDELAELCSQLDLHEVYAFAHRSDAVYFAELMVVQYACDQLIGIDNANIKECLASDAQKYALKPRTRFATACVIKSTLLASIKLLCESVAKTISGHRSNGLSCRPQSETSCSCFLCVSLKGIAGKESPISAAGDSHHRLVPLSKRGAGPLNFKVFTSRMKPKLPKCRSLFSIR